MSEVSTERLSAFLEDDEVRRLTGRKVRALQIQQLRTMGIPFFVNALGRAVVARSAVESRKPVEATEKPWRPNVLARA